jgi:hypothetical protein
VESERNGNGVGPDEGCWKRIGARWRLERIGAKERLGESCRKMVGSVVAVVVVAGVAVAVVGRLGLELDPEGNLVEQCWNCRLVVLEPGVGGGAVCWRCWNRVVLQGAEFDLGGSVSSRQTVGSVAGAVMFAAGAVMCAGAVMLVGAERCWNRVLAVLEP